MYTLVISTTHRTTLTFVAETQQACQMLLFAYVLRWWKVELETVPPLDSTLAIKTYFDTVKDEFYRIADVTKTYTEKDAWNVLRDVLIEEEPQKEEPTEMLVILCVGITTLKNGEDDAVEYGIFSAVNSDTITEQLFVPTHEISEDLWVDLEPGKYYTASMTTHNGETVVELLAECTIEDVEV